MHRNDPDNTEALSALAAAYASAKEYEKASAVLMRLLEIEPGELRHYTDLANVYTAAGDYEKALETLESAKSLDSSSSVYAAAARSAEGDKAIGLWKKVIERSPSYVNAYESLADLYAARGDYTDALRILEEGQEKSGDSVLSGKANVIRQKMAAAGIGDEDGNPLEKLSEALNRYKDALQQMARRDFMDIIDTLEKQYNEENEISDDADTTKRKVLEITLSGSLVTEEEKSAQEAASSSKKSGKSGSRQSETIKVTLGYLKAFETKTMVVTAADGTRITAYRPAYVDELERTVIGQYGSDQYGYGTYVLADGTALSSVQYVAPLNP